VIISKVRRAGGLSGLKGGQSLGKKLPWKKPALRRKRALERFKQTWKAGRIDPAPVGDSWCSDRKNSAVLLTDKSFSRDCTCRSIRERNVVSSLLPFRSCCISDKSIVRFLRATLSLSKTCEDPAVLEAILGSDSLHGASLPRSLSEFRKKARPASSRQFPP